MGKRDARALRKRDLREPDLLARSSQSIRDRLEFGVALRSHVVGVRTLSVDPYVS